MWCSSDQGESAGRAPSARPDATDDLTGRSVGAAIATAVVEPAGLASMKAASTQAWQHRGRATLTQRQVGLMGGHGNQASELRFRRDRCHTTRRDAISAQAHAPV